MQEDGRIGRRHFLDCPRDFHDARRLADDGRQTVPPLELVFEQQILVPKLAMFLTSPKQKQEVVDVDRFLDEIERPELHGLNRVFDRAECGHDDDRTIRIALLHLFEHRDAIRAGQA